MAGGTERIVRGKKKPCALSTKLQHFTPLHQLKALPPTELFFIPFFFPHSGSVAFSCERHGDYRGHSRGNFSAVRSEAGNSSQAFRIYADCTRVAVLSLASRCCSVEARLMWNKGGLVNMLVLCNVFRGPSAYSGCSRCQRCRRRREECIWSRYSKICSAVSLGDKWFQSRLHVPLTWPWPPLTTEQVQSPEKMLCSNKARVQVVDEWRREWMRDGEGGWTSQVQVDNEITCLLTENYLTRPCTAARPSHLPYELG